ncbi:carboxymuconolactone decarboxylase family protein [Neisseriaceae bacterium TC5R-5]|nr:carboxymuconolactone decarboxylase family protein [Neisseriaceae bacterium TC5R-5]
MSDFQPRVNWPAFEKNAADVLVAMDMLGKAIDNSGLDGSLLELMRIRVSQLNGCAFCVQYHLNGAREIGLSSTKTDLVAVWREVGLFSTRERAMLNWAEALTLMANRPISNEVYSELKAEFSEAEIISLTSAVGAINVWNRIAGGLHFAPPPPAK